MTGQTKKVFLMGYLLLFLLVGISCCCFKGVNGAGECGKSTSPDFEALKLIPCASAASDTTSIPSASCCRQVRNLGKNPSCLCAVMLSNTAKNSGVKAEIAITIPKRCNILNRPVGYKCGDYTLP
ncbi:uncharacterized protein LOC124930742 [Impatiens glandulifera]|uniref:uncharacterized protein LOC124930742 n=1 Tax=Impatiens glandulifera TaxID=253017 RepID=UPI001FB10FF8|nr:uncharacterized protein LOC124930742 [Impatiens glandulifera]